MVARPCSLLRSTKLVSLPRPVSMVSHGIAGRSGPEISITSAPCAASVRPATGTRDHPRQVQHAQSGERPVAGRPRPWGGLADLLDRHQGLLGQRLAVRRCQPFLARAHHRYHAAGGIGRGLERLGVPLHQRGLDMVALGLAAQHLADGIAVMAEIGVQPHEAPIAGVVDSGDRIPGGSRRLAVDAQIALAAALDDGVAHVDRNVLRLPAAQFPDLRRGQSRRGDAGLRRGADAKRRRQLRLFAGQRDAVERGKVPARSGPEIGQNFARRLHEETP